MSVRFLLTAVLLAGLATTAQAQSHFILNDRINHMIFRAVDGNNDLDLDDSGELNVYFSEANAAGTLAPANPTCLDIGANGFVVMGDQVNRNVYLLRDLNDDGDVQDVGESIVFADATNLSGISFAFPTGITFDSLGRIHVANAGNGLGSDGIYRLVDLNGDGAAQDSAEITEYVGVPFFGEGNGPYGPQEIYFDVEDTLFMHNSSTGLNGVYRFRDLDHNGRADDAGEATTYWDATNADGMPVYAGFAIEPDRVRARSMYILQTASGSVDQLVRLTDANNDGDAQGAGESAVVWSAMEAGFISVDVVSLVNGDVLITDNSGKRVIRLHDANNDGDFLDAGERVDYYTNPDAVMGDVRQMSVLPIPGDVNRDLVRDLGDLDAFVNVLCDTDFDPLRRLAADVNKSGKPDGDDCQHLGELLTAP